MEKAAYIVAQPYNLNRWPVQRAGQTAAIAIMCCVTLLIAANSTKFYMRDLWTAPSNSKTQSFDELQVSVSNLGRSDFNWESIAPSRELRYVPCAKRYECARLLLPMDWSASQERRWDYTVVIALMKLPANVSSITDPRYAGELYIDPGGPGASGLHFLKGRGEYLDQIVNSESKAFDIIGFDPRGLGMSTPRYSCFGPGNTQGRDLFTVTEGTYGWSDAGLAKVWARAEAFAKMCDPGNSTAEEAVIKGHMSTASVARDLLEIIERSGELRGMRLRDILALEKPSSDQHNSAFLESLVYKPSQEKLQYWGFSYGTDIGGYFASMFPSRIKRMVLDGNGYSPDWASGKWNSFLNTTDESFRTLFQACFAAGEDKCALFDGNGSQAIEDNVMSILAELRTVPISVWAEGMMYPEVLTYEMVIESIFTATYKPYIMFPPLVRALAALKDRHNLNMTSIAILLPEQGIRCSDEACTYDDCAGEDGAWYHEVNVAVTCSDTATAQPNRTFTDFREWANFLHNQSKLFGGYFSSDSTMACHQWPKPKFSFDGPFGGRTDHPILFVGNMLDPISPMVNTLEMARIFGGGVLSINSGGHCSPNVPSSCAAKHIRRYLHYGELPEPNTVCEVDYPLFGEPKETHAHIIDITDRLPQKTRRWIV